MAGWQLQDLDLRGHARRPARGWTRAARCCSAARSTRTVEQDLRAARRAGVPRGAGRAASTPTARTSTPPTSCTTGSRPGTTPAPSTPGSTPGPGQTGHDLHAPLAQALHDLAVDDALAEWVAGRRLVGVMGGHALAARQRRLRRRGPARACPGPGRADRRAPAAARARWRPRTSAPTSPATTTPRCARRSTCSPPCRRFEPSVGDWARSAFDVRTEVPGRHRVAGRADLVLRARAAQRVRRRWSRSTSRTRSARTSCCTSAPPGIVFLPGARRDRAGGVPGRLRELLRRGRRGGPDGAGRHAATGPRSCPVWPLLQRLAAGREMARPRAPGRRPRRGRGAARR